MSVLVEQRDSPAGARFTERVDIVIPVYNEQAVLERSVRRLHEFLRANVPLDWHIVIADNASTDGTLSIARALSDELESLTVLHLDAKGRGRALRCAWSTSDADVRCYMDVDLSTDLRALLPLLAGLISGHSDVAIGTRLVPGARVVRGPKRELISRAYNGLLRLVLRARFSDAQCGFKAISADAARELLPVVRDEGWFFDTELLLAAQRRGLRIHEVAVDWADDPDSRVEIVKTVVEDLRGILRLLVDARSHGGRARGGPHARLTSRGGGPGAHEGLRDADPVPRALYAVQHELVSGARRGAAVRGAGGVR